MVYASFATDDGFTILVLILNHISLCSSDALVLILNHIPLCSSDALRSHQPNPQGEQVIRAVALVVYSNPRCSVCLLYPHIGG